MCWWRRRAGQKPKRKASPLWKPKPVSDASEKQTWSGPDIQRAWPLNVERKRSHHSKSSQKEGERRTGRAHRWGP